MNRSDAKTVAERWRTGQTGSKYLSSDSKHLIWSQLWMSLALDITRPGGVLACFCDWRQWTPTTDAMQAGGWVWRGVVPWLKSNARPQRGRFMSASEFVVWGSAGPMSDEGECHPGHFLGMPPRDREHITEKPLDFMRQLVAIAPLGGLVLDPFNGSGTTGVAALLTGRRYIGIERTEEYCAISARRLTQAAGGMGVGRHGQLGLLGANG